jgi:nitroimidazol reductase NimA-like FMN-containing flavoprotein (pyridoxamine 5'-phosphate oxidase superfamily)
MTKMPGTEIRRKDRQGSVDDAMQQLSKASVGCLSVTLEDGHPYAVPVNFALDGNTILIHSAKSGQKISALLKEDRVCFLVSEMIELVEGKVPCEYGARFESTIAFGKARFLEGDAKLHGLEVISLKYTGMKGPISAQDADRVSVIAVEIASVTNKRRK